MITFTKREGAHRFTDTEVALWAFEMVNRITKRFNNDSTLKDDMEYTASGDSLVVITANRYADGIVRFSGYITKVTHSISET